jgi:hypothetical protein
VKPDRNPADTINEAVGGTAGGLLDALAAALAEDVAAAEHQVTTLKSPVVKRLRGDAETVADRFEAVSEEANAAQRRARAERMQLRRVRTQLEKDLERLAVEPIEERGNGRRKR